MNNFNLQKLLVRKVITSGEDSQGTQKLNKLLYFLELFAKNHLCLLLDAKISKCK